MPTNFNPQFSISVKMANALARIEVAKAKVKDLPVNPRVIASLRMTAKLLTAHYSTQIEGNQLTPNEVKDVITLEGHFPGREREEKEVKGYYTALNYLEKHVAAQKPLTEKVIQTLHALVMSGGKEKVKPTPYRDGQNVVTDGISRQIIYMPPEAKDVSGLMKNLVLWIKEKVSLPAPIVAAIAHYQFATIHPYYDGNGRTARLLTTLILHMNSYDLNGLYLLEEYYAKNLLQYYKAISVGPSHNYYMGRAESDITKWIEYFLEGIANAFEKVFEQMKKSKDKGGKNYDKILRSLDPKQRKVLPLFYEYDEVTSSQIGGIFGFKSRTNSSLCKKWVEEGFLEVANPSNKTRTYRLARKFLVLLH